MTARTPVRLFRSRKAKLARSHWRQLGGGLVEHALVLVIFLSVVFAIIDFGRAMYTLHYVSNAAREAARWASVRSSTSQAPNAPATPGAMGSVQSTFASSSALAGMGIDPNKLTFDTTWPPTPTGPTACNVGANHPGCVVQVHVKYTYEFMFPLLPTGTFDMNSTSKMVITQ